MKANDVAMKDSDTYITSMSNTCDTTTGSIVSTANVNEPCCKVKDDKNSAGIIYCSNQCVSFKLNRIKLEASLSEYRQMVKHRGHQHTHIQIKERKLIGMLEIWDHIEIFGGFMELNNAWERYRCHQHSVQDIQRFTADLLHKEIGLSVHIVQFNVHSCDKVRIIIPKDSNLDTGDLIEILETKKEVAMSNDHMRINIASTLQDALQTMDTDYDRSIAKVLVAANISDKQCQDMGLSIDSVKKSIEHMNFVVAETKNAELAAKDLFRLQTQDKAKKTNEKLEKAELILHQHKHTISTKVREEIEDKIETLKNRSIELKSLLNEPQANSVKCKKAVKRLKLALLEDNRVKRRKSGGGRKSALTSEDEDFISQCIEEHAAVDGRRKKDVLYFARRLKQKDLLSIMNFHLLEKGRQAIKSAKTIMNRSCPHNKRSVQAKKNHRGKWLFCSKKPPKTALHEHIHTRHQRQARKLSKFHAVTGAHGKVSPSDFLVMSKDDKAYMRPATTGKQIWPVYHSPLVCICNTLLETVSMSLEYFLVLLMVMCHRTKCSLCSH